MVAIIFRNALADGNDTSFFARSQKAGVVEAEEYYRSFGWLADTVPVFWRYGRDSGSDPNP
jgi:hypothetical protein